MVSQQCHCLSTGLKPGVNERDFWGKAVIDQEVADRWGLLTAAARNGGIVLPVNDGLLAATALEHNLTLVTRDTGQIPSTGVAVFNPWDKTKAGYDQYR